MEYPFNEIEKKWQNIWKEKHVFSASENSDKPNYYVLSMFPYPSGVLHMGHVSNYSIGDAIARYMMMKGYNVMQPMGFDAFGMPAENFAIKHNTHPAITTKQNVEAMKDQFDFMGFGFDWDREVNTSTPSYYKWGQWFFKRMYEKGLAYKKSSFVNWCDKCQTVLANEQVEDGKCWRCSSAVRQKELEQWSFKITDYAEELLDFSDIIDWPGRVITMQKNWIGKNFGTNIFFKLENSDEIIKVFTTRPDTIFGCTFMALPPEHPLIMHWLEHEAKDSEMVKFCNKIINENKIQRAAEDTIKEGIFSGRYAINPVNNEKVQIWITNYVLMDYGTGAVMAVPTHDQRDFEFAKKYDIPMKIVISPKDEELVLDKMTKAYVESGILINSGKFNGIDSITAKKDITKWMNEEKTGEESITYRLRDWGISRQRYWGNPIPVIYCEHCGVVLVEDKDLPVELPGNVKVGKTTQNPLLSVDEWVNVKCPKCGRDAKRETDTMDTFVDSSWYFARYSDPKNDNKPFSKEQADKWLPVNQYIGGIEHACMHLLYARFFHKFMRDLGMVSSNEPFARLLTQGMVTKDGFKMSKSKGNVVDPQYIIDRYGADTVRTFMMFASPPEKDVEWSDEGVKGAFRFLNRLWRVFDSHKEIIKKYQIKYSNNINSDVKKLRFSTHHTIQKALVDIERMQFNTVIAAVMEHLNNIYAIGEPTNLSDEEKAVYAEACSIIPKLMYPFAPHISEELWQMVNSNAKMLHEEELPKYNKKYLVKDEVTYVIQIMGKIRGKLIVPSETDVEAVKEKALNLENVKKYLVGKEIKKIIVVPKKLVSIVAK